MKEAKKSKKKSLGDLGHESYQQLSTYVPGMDLPFILGLTMQKKYPVSNDSDFMDLFPPRGAYRYGYRLRKILDHYSKSGDAEIAKKNLLSESLGSYTAVASAGIVALGIAKLLGKDPSWKHFSKGALIGSGIALGGWLLGESKPTQRSIPAQQDYDNKAKFLSWLIPGFASYNRT
ncbi:MAG: hypothetical protein U9Q38_04345, partial [Thermodesulfobacteriota bacterium]|nr:hypothetical protein [Thermodesulfobacteriota bacterium]